MGAFPPGWTAGYHTTYGSNFAALSADPAAGLRVKKAGPVGGTVTSSPAGINCPTKHDETVESRYPDAYKWGCLVLDAVRRVHLCSINVRAPTCMKLEADQINSNSML